MLRIVFLITVCLSVGPSFAFEYQGHLVDGERDGLWITTNKGSVLSRCHYKEGLLNGSCIKYDASELPTSIGTYLNGQQHGNWQYFEKGVLKSEGPYVADEKHGIWTLYDDNGKLFFKKEFRHGVEEGLVEKYHSNGQLEYSHPKFDGLAQGLWVDFYDSGQVKSIGSYDGFRKIGIWSYYYSNGQLQMRGTYFGREKIGDWLYYEPDGTLSRIPMKNADEDI